MKSAVLVGLVIDLDGSVEEAGEDGCRSREAVSLDLPNVPRI